MTGLPPLTEVAITASLNAIATEFRPGAKLTLLVRHETTLDADLVMTNDTLPHAIAALTRRLEAQQERSGISEVGD